MCVFGGVALAQSFRIDKKDEPDPVNVGANLTYTLEVRNTSSTTQTGVVVRDKLPEGVTFVGFRDVDSDESCTRDGRDVTCTFATIAPNTTETVRIVVEPENEGEITNRAEVYNDASSTSPAATIEIETDVEDDEPTPTPSPAPTPAPPRFPNFPFFPNNPFVDERELQEELEEAENELEALDEGEGTTDEGVSAEADEGVASAETPGASAQSGDPDAFSPERSVRGDVVDEVPTEGPLPNTGGASLWAFVLPTLGVLLLGAALLRRFGR